MHFKCLTILLEPEPATISPCIIVLGESQKFENIIIFPGISNDLKNSSISLKNACKNTSISKFIAGNDIRVYLTGVTSYKICGAVLVLLVERNIELLGKVQRRHKAEIVHEGTGTRTTTQSPQPHYS